MRHARWATQVEKETGLTFRTLAKGHAPIYIGVMGDSDRLVRNEVYYSGRVQGVGFRQTVRRLADDFTVAGFVENLPDGRVHLIAEGAKEEVKAFREAITRRMSGFIVKETVDERPAQGDTGAFTIRT